LPVMITALKWFGIGALIVALLFVALRFYFESYNVKVADELRTQPQGDRAQKVMMIAFPDGEQIPVNYLREGDKVFTAADGRWWRHFKGQGAEVQLLIKGEELSGHGVVILDDPAYVHDVFARLRPTAPAWLPDWLNGRLVVIRLDEAASQTP
ncbi:MAG: hypothetical protein ACR2PJ_06060, partial [Pseudomonadales bacterium]